MNIKIKYLHFLLSLVLTIGPVVYFNAQQNDSLLRLLAGTIEDTSKVKLYSKIGAAFINQSNYDSATKYLQQGIRLAEQSLSKTNTAEKYGKKLRKGLMRLYSNMGIVYDDQADYPGALQCYEKSLKLAEMLNDKVGISSCYNNIGLVYQNLSQTPTALDYYNKGLSIREELHDSDGIAKSYNNIGVLYYTILNYPKALEYYSRSLKIKEKQGDKAGIASCYMNMAIIYQDQNDNRKGLQYFERALKLALEINHKRGIGMCYNNMGVMYHEIGETDKAIEYFKYSIGLADEMGDLNQKAACLVNLGDIYRKKKEFNKSASLFSQAIELCREINDIDDLRLAYGGLAETQNSTGNYKEAYANHVIFKQLTDSIFNAENSKQLSDIKTNFEVEKKEAELRAINKAEKEKMEIKAAEDKRRQNIIIYSVVAGLVLVTIFSVFIFRGLQQNKKAYRIIAAQKKEVERQKELVEEKQKEILDSIHYARRIQRSLLTNEKYIEKRLKRLLN